MKHWRPATVIGLLCILPVCAPMLAAAQPIEAPPRIEVSAQSSSTPLDGILELEVRLLNPESDDDSKLVVYGHMWTGVVIQVRATDGTELHPEGWTHYHELCPPPPPRESDFVSLDPGQFLGTSIRVAPSDLGIDTAGTYIIRAQYWVTTSADGADWRVSLRRQPIESAPITVTVSAANLKNE